MSRLMKCLKFEARFLYKSLLTFLAFYYGIYFALAAIALLLLGHSGSGDMNSAFYVGASIFAFVIATSTYKSIFNNLLMFGNTRRNILFSSFTVYAGLSAVLSILTVASGFLDDFMTRFMSFNGISLTSISFLTLIYEGRANIFEEMLWYFGFYIMLFSFSLLFGTLAYKFGKVFRIVFWVGFGLSFMLGPTGFIDIIKFLLGWDNQYGILIAPLNFAVFSVIFGAAAYVIASRQAQET